MTARAKRITVTGGSGFLGARLVSLLREDHQPGELFEL